MRDKCKRDLQTAILYARIFPALFSMEEFLQVICERYGTEFVADVMMEMGYGHSSN